MRASAASCFSVKRFLSHRFSISNWAIRASRDAFFSVVSRTVRSSVCSRCFFFMRKRALAAVFRRLRSSSAMTRLSSSWVRAEARRSPGTNVLYLVFPTWPVGGDMDEETSEGVKAPGAWPRSSPG